MPRTKLLQAVLATPWALTPEVYHQMRSIVSRHVAGEKLPREEIDAIVARGAVGRDRRERHMDTQDGIAVMPIHGVIAPHASAVNDISSQAGTSVEHIRADLRSALKNPDVHSILMDVDSPGGSVDGITELAAELYAARQQKPLYALADSQMSSAAYWLGSQAQKVWSTPGAMVGSVGVIAEVFDDSAMFEAAGIKPYVLSTSKAKAAAAPPIDAEDLQTLQATIDAYFALFRGDIARGRGIEGEALDRIASGHSWVGQQARQRGFVDAVAMRDEVFAAIQKEHRAGMRAATRTAAAVPEIEPAAEGAAVQHAEEEPMTVEQKTAPQAQAPQPEDLTGLSAEALQQRAPRAAAALVEQGAAQERARIQAIRSQAVAGQENLVEQLVADGSSEADALKALHGDLKARHGQQLEAVRQTRKPVQPDATYTEPEGAGKAAKGKGTLEEQAKADWTLLAEADRKAFKTFERFFAVYKRDPDFAMGRKESDQR